MKKIFVCILCAFLLCACGTKLQNADIAGDWTNDAAAIHFNEDGTYDIRYFNAEAGELTNESGKYELDGGKIKLKRRDKYTLSDTGDVKFERLIHAENRTEKISLENDETLKLNGETYTKSEMN